MSERASFGGIFPLFVSLALSACSGEPTEEPLGTAAASLSTAEITLESPFQVAGKISHPASLNLHTSADGCFNSPGPTITIGGDLQIAGLTGKVIITNNMKGTHTASAYAEASVSLHGKDDVIEIPKQPSRGGVGGNPHIWLQVFDEDYKAYGDRIYLGRCNKLLPASKIDFTALSDIDFGVGYGDCMNRGGPTITITGALKLRGINAKLFLSNNLKGTHTADEEVELSINVLKPGQSIYFDKSPRFGNGAGGNPFVWVQLLDDHGDAISKELLLGRCNKL